MGRLEVIVVDTHVFIWFALDDSRLTPKLKSKLAAARPGVYLPSICIWEALLSSEKGRLSFGGSDPASTLMELVEESGFTVAPLTIEIVLLSRKLPFKHDDPADRFIAATAHALGASLATSDRLLRTLPWVRLAD